MAMGETTKEKKEPGGVQIQSSRIISVVINGQYINYEGKTKNRSVN